MEGREGWSRREGYKTGREKKERAKGKIKEKEKGSRKILNVGKSVTLYCNSKTT